MLPQFRFEDLNVIMIKYQTMETNNHPIIGNGKICYIEILAVDIDASASFYQKVFY